MYDFDVPHTGLGCEGALHLFHHDSVISLRIPLLMNAYLYGGFPYGGYGYGLGYGFPGYGGYSFTGRAGGWGSLYGGFPGYYGGYGGYGLGYGWGMAGNPVAAVPLAPTPPMYPHVEQAYHSNFINDIWGSFHDEFPAFPAPPGWHNRSVPETPMIYPSDYWA
jgi:hypothetical protein